MPPKEQFDKEKIVKTAIKIVEKEGIGSLSARRISKELCCSTAPIYRIFKSMDQLEREVIESILALLMSYTEKKYTDHTFLNVGAGIISFARDYNRFYRILFMDTDKYAWATEKYYSQLKDVVKGDNFVRHFSDKEGKNILEKMSVFTHGLGALICSGLIKESDVSHKELIGFLKDTGGDILRATILKRSNTGGDIFKNLSGSRYEKDNSN